MNPRPETVRQPAVYASVIIAMTLAFFVSCPAHAQQGVSGANQQTGSEQTDGKDAQPAEMPSAGEVAEGLGEGARGLGRRILQSWRAGVSGLAERQFFAWVLCIVLLAVGCASLGFGWTLVHSLFVPIVTGMGALTGGYFALQARLATNPEAGGVAQTVFLILGGGFGLTLFLICALKARPVAWILFVAAPFCALSALIFHASVPVALFTVAAGLGLGFITTFARRTVTIIATALMGGLLLAFCAGLLAYLLDAQFMQKGIDASVQHPLFFAVALVLVIFVGADVQLMLGKVD